MRPQELELLKSQRRNWRRGMREKPLGLGTLGVMATEPLAVSVRMRQSSKLCPTPFKIRTAECTWQQRCHW